MGFWNKVIAESGSAFWECPAPWASSILKHKKNIISIIKLNKCKAQGKAQEVEGSYPLLLKIVMDIQVHHNVPCEQLPNLRKFLQVL